MCKAHLTVYPCNHTVLNSYVACRVGQTPQTCSPASLKLDIKTYYQHPYGIAPSCPAAKLGRTCFRPPLDPILYAEACVQKDTPFEDAVALISAWVFDLDGKIFGTRRLPWRAEEYVVALMHARQGVPRTVWHQTPDLFHVPNTMRQAEDDSEPAVVFLRLGDSLGRVREDDAMTDD